MRTPKAIVVCVMLLQLSYSNAQTFSFDHNSVSRSYIVHLPPSYSDSNSYPLIINMHGYGSDAIQEQFYAEMDAVADTANFIVVYPNGVSNSWNSGQTWSYNPGINDVTFISALIDTMAKNYSIDTLMVYACGMSNGGYMSYRLACELENKIAAIASVTGVMSDSVYNACQTDRPVPILHMHGTADPTVAYNGTFGNTAVETGIAWWVQNNNCPSTPDTTIIPDIDTLDGSTVEKYYYGPCDDSTEVVLFKIIGGEHTWPGVSYIIAVTNQDIDGSGEAWLFFKKHKLPYTPPPASSSDLTRRKEEIRVYPNPFTDIVTLMNIPKDIETFQLYDLLGKSLGSIKVETTNTKIQINLADIPRGTYLIKAVSKQYTYKSLLVKL